ncbi:MAG: M20/M25/M40 family metallo-hydrolase [Clostridia bacterium]|nr:M20/M25/M40 family metallo-hydrolase [Clostridia bacterium]
MKKESEKELDEYIASSVKDAEELLEKLCTIPAPSGYEDERAAFIKNWLDDIGAEGVYIDEAKNVVFPVAFENGNGLVCFEAHTDTVFPAPTPLNYVRDGDKLLCPGIGDDTANLVNMLMTLRFIVTRKIKPRRGVIFVANSCEEGLGNLKGTKRIFSDYAGRIERFFSFDGDYNRIYTECVGSHRYRIELKTEGGHSWGHFGNTNAITELSKLIVKLSQIPLPVKDGKKTTFNVGVIGGGTSVNTIAQNAFALYEYRSDDADSLHLMKERFYETLLAFKNETKAEVSVELVGDRPCGEAKDKLLQEEMINRAVKICEETSGLECKRISGSTDCNVPLSLGVAAICPGLILGGGAHTREEWIYSDSIKVGMKIGAKIILDYFEL